MSNRDRSLREDLEKRLLSIGSKIPTSSLGRIGRTALAGLRGGRLAWRGKNEDAALDEEALAAIVASVGQLKGVAMKAGQLLSYLDLPLPPELRSALAALQTHSPSMPFDRVSEIIRRELGAHAPQLLDRMDPTPAAAASIGQVHRSTLPDGTHVAVKVQYPDIETAIGNDFRSAAVATSFVRLLVPHGNVDGIVGEARRAILEECDYLREASYQRRFGRIYEAHPTIVVPAVHDAFCSRHVLTTTWLDGSRFDAFLSTNPPQTERDHFGEALFEFYVGTLFGHRLYNWDPHPGNYVVERDGRLGMLDYGSTREFDRAFVQKLAALTRAVHSDDRDALHHSLVELGMVREGKPYDYETARALVRSFYGPMLRDEVLTIERGEALPLRTVLETKRELLKLHLPGEFLFVLRIRFGVMSVLAQLGARANWYELERRFVESASSSDGGNARSGA
jgi:predicted unusual protein kinase regulating ubiquinone biosynthesis (AarF/ABC1/UbiB family)